MRRLLIVQSMLNETLLAALTNSAPSVAPMSWFRLDLADHLVLLVSIPVHPGCIFSSTVHLDPSTLDVLDVHGFGLDETDLSELVEDVAKWLNGGRPLWHDATTERARQAATFEASWAVAGECR